ncbi:hypothetical protein COCVIDRAFT_99944 [Bipolaris victoriae FI3]|uniref:Uncharacterized protein n=1 Tax=Bipolaris victoriae (strain FI3) TaxID=930091 RepID=W7EF17_BIPV3|nr:hypothetical protein COCVIDRAFT_99944 [Bipolaris victoriae FI3]
MAENEASARQKVDLSKYEDDRQMSSSTCFRIGRSRADNFDRMRVTDGCDGGSPDGHGSARA